MQMADVVSQRSKDPNTKVGAVLVCPERDRVATGYNGFPAGLEETQERWDDKYRYVVHAEMNAILNARCDLREWTLYTTMFPCCDCTKMLLQTGISRIVYRDTHSNSVGDSLDKSISLFREMDVTIERHN